MLEDCVWTHPFGWESNQRNTVSESIGVDDQCYSSQPGSEVCVLWVFVGPYGV